VERPCGCLDCHLFGKLEKGVVVVTPFWGVLLLEEREGVKLGETLRLGEFYFLLFFALVFF
jgi:hypothetical protein